MPLVTMRQLLDEAAKGGYGVGAFNVNNMEQIQAIMEAARETKSPVIIQVSRGARKYSNDRFLFHLMLAAVELYPEIPVALHQDHGNSPETCRSAIEMGFTSVMMDGSLLEDGKTPASYEYNVRVTREVVEMAHARGVSVEGELGVLGGIEDGHGAGVDAMAHLTDPDQAVDFVERTGVDALAVAIGTSHGAYKFKGQQSLHFDVIEKIRDKVAAAGLPPIPIVMHGSSSVPREEVLRINAAGGQLDPDACGVNPAEYLPAARLGVTKVNIDTDGRLVWTRVHREYFRDHPREFDFRPPGKIFMDEYARFIAQKNQQLGSAGMLDEVRRALAA